MKGRVGCTDHNSSITTQKGPSLLWGKQEKKGKGLWYQKRQTEVDVENRTQPKFEKQEPRKKDNFLLHENSWFASKFYQEQWISHTSKYLINCPATLPPEIT